jgi:hypothetical protein
VPDRFSDELRALRERAYGPAADIHEDPQALLRLRELEELSRPSAGNGTSGSGTVPPPSAGSLGGDVADPLPEADRRAAEVPLPGEEPDVSIRRPRLTSTFPGGAGEPPALPVGAAHQPAAFVTGSAARDEAARADSIPPDVDSPAPGAEAGSETAADERPTDTETPATPWWRRRVVLLWAGSLVLTALIAVGATLWTVQSKGRVAVLQVAEKTEWPEAVLGDPPPDSRVFESYLGLIVVVMPQSWGPGEGMDCLYVLERSGQGMMSTVGCAAGVFAPSAALSVSERAPDELRERYADDTALQFVLDGDLVHVYAQEP